MTIIDMGRAMTMGSTAVHGEGRSVTLPKIAWQSPRGFASAAWKNAVQTNQITAPVTMLYRAAFVEGAFT
jgi:hypothetical protein